MSSKILINSLKIRENVYDYINSLFTVKAMSIQMPKFGKDTDLIIKGICKLILSEEDLNWLRYLMANSLQALDAAMESSYMSIKLVEEKIHYFGKICKTLFNYGAPLNKQFATEMLVPRVPVLIPRFWDLICSPLARDDDLLASEKERVNTTLAELSSYSDLVGLAI